jgi:hypothetical protein
MCMIIDVRYLKTGRRDNSLGTMCIEWINEVKLSPTPSPDDDEEYENMHLNYEANQNTRQRHMSEDLI